MIKYDLNDIGIDYRGPATTKTKEITFKKWIINKIPIHISEQVVKDTIAQTLNNICAIEMPTSLKCNLRCQYCYIRDPRLKNKKILTNDIKKILTNIKSKLPRFDPNIVNKRKKVHLTSWGAEPFCNIDTLELLYEFGHNVYGKDNYTIGLSTNGTIWTDRIEKLFANIIKDNAMPQVQISLDGPKHVQDYYRPSNKDLGSFDNIHKTTIQLNKLLDSLNVKKNYHFCSTIFLKDDNFIKHYIDAAKFFTDENSWHYAPMLPMRTSGEDLDNDEEIKKFVEAQKQIYKFIKQSVIDNPEKFIVDNYTARLFGQLSNRSLNAFPYCSALNTQLGIDVDGSIYMCHGPITSPEYKPYLWFGNLFDGVISYKQFIRNKHYTYGGVWTKSKCKECPLYKYPVGNICWSCAPHNLAVTSHPMIDRLNKCIAYANSFKYWLRIAKMIYTGSAIDHISDELMGLNNEKLPKLQNRKNVIDSKMHFDINYNGILDNSLSQLDPYRNKQDRNFIDYIEDWWWDEDDYFDKNIKDQ